jgi:uncharacterized protein (DUF433 family)
MRNPRQTALVDWTDCPLVEVNPLKLSGVPILKRLRLQADAIVDNYESGSPVEEIFENFGIPVEKILEVLAYAAEHRMQPAR